MVWFRKAAEQDYALAQFDLGRCYHEGNGVERSDKTAQEWLGKAADNGCEEASEYAFRMQLDTPESRFWTFFNKYFRFW